MEELLDEAPVPRDGNAWDPEAMRWTGCIYRYRGSCKHIEPPAIYGIVDGLAMASLHPGCHALDDERAIDRPYELLGAVLYRKKAGTPPTAQANAATGEKGTRAAKTARVPFSFHPRHYRDYLRNFHIAFCLRSEPRTGLDAFLFFPSPP